MKKDDKRRKPMNQKEIKRAEEKEMRLNEGLNTLRFEGKIAAFVEVTNKGRDTYHMVAVLPSHIGAIEETTCEFEFGEFEYLNGIKCKDIEKKFDIDFEDFDIKESTEEEDCLFESVVEYKRDGECNPITL